MEMINTRQSLVRSTTSRQRKNLGPWLVSTSQGRFCDRSGDRGRMWFSRHRTTMEEEERESHG